MSSIALYIRIAYSITINIKDLTGFARPERKDGMLSVLEAKYSSEKVKTIRLSNIIERLFAVNAF